MDFSFITEGLSADSALFPIILAAGIAASIHFGVWLGKKVAGFFDR